MGWEAAGSDEKVEAAMAMADSDPAMLRRDMMSQKKAAMEMQLAKKRQRELRRAQAVTLEEAQERLNERGYVHGDQFMVIDKEGRMFGARLDLTPLPAAGSIPRLLESPMSVEDQEKLIDKAKREIARAEAGLDTDSEQV
jgi:hypothetical protein